MGELSPWHWAIIAVVVLVLFGSKKLPDAARSLGRSLRIFKSEVSGLHDDEQAVSALGPAPTDQAAAPPVASPVTASADAPSAPPAAPSAEAPHAG